MFFLEKLLICGWIISSITCQDYGGDDSFGGGSDNDFGGDFDGGSESNFDFDNTNIGGGDSVSNLDNTYIEGDSVSNIDVDVDNINIGGGGSVSNIALDFNNINIGGPFGSGFNNYIGGFGGLSSSFVSYSGSGRYNTYYNNRFGYRQSGYYSNYRRPVRPTYFNQRVRPQRGQASKYYYSRRI